MVDWQERISRGTAPAIRVEHDVRYAAAAPLILDSAVWADLGCGTGVSSAAALAGRFHGRAILVDVDEDAVRTASEELRGADVETHAADLSSPEDVARVRAAIEAAPAGPRLVTCFETVEHLKAFPPLVEALVELAEGDVTVVLSVPNDAHTGVENPYHESVWGEGSFDELRSLLPEGTVLARQIPLAGSVLVPGDAAAEAGPVAVEVPAGLVPSHLLAAFGPRAGELGVTAAATPVDLEDQRRWERQREADVAFFEVAMKHAQEQAAQVPELRQTAQEHIARVDEFRRYIHELEDRLGIPRAGSAEAPPAAGR